MHGRHLLVDAHGHQQEARLQDGLGALWRSLNKLLVQALASAPSSSPYCNSTQGVEDAGQVFCKTVSYSDYEGG